MQPNLTEELNLAELSNEQIIDLRVKIEKEFFKRRIRFSVGEIGETISINFFNNTPGFSNLQKAPTGTKNVDALSRNGDRYSIKTIKAGGKTGTVYPDAVDPNKQLFEYILIVQLDENFELQALHRFTWIQFLTVRQWDKTMNAWYIPKSQKALKKGDTIFKK